MKKVQNRSPTKKHPKTENVCVCVCVCVAILVVSIHQINHLLTIWLKNWRISPWNTFELGTRADNPWKPMSFETNILTKAWENKRITLGNQKSKVIFPSEFSLPPTIVWFFFRHSVFSCVSYRWLHHLVSPKICQMRFLSTVALEKKCLRRQPRSRVEGWQWLRVPTL